MRWFLQLIPERIKPHLSMTHSYFCNTIQKTCRLLSSVAHTTVRFFRRSPRFAAGLLSVFLLILSFSTVVMTAGVTTAYAVMYNGQSLGTVKSAAVLAEAEILAVDKLDNAACTARLIRTELATTFATKQSLVTAECLADNMIAHSNDIISAAVLSIDNQPIAAEEQVISIQKALSDYVDTYKVENSLQSVELCTNVEVNQVYTLKSEYEKLPSVADYLATNQKAVPLQTVDTVVKTEKVPYQTVCIESSKYTIGTEIVKCAGKSGLSEVTYKVATANGKVLETVKLSSKAISKPVTKQVIIGTKHVIAADKNGDTPMIWPVKRVPRSYVSSYVGDGRGHKGMDIVAPAGTPIYAADAGTVIFSGYKNNGYGNYVIIRHANGLETLYAHCKSLYVKNGDKIAAGESIASVGNTGRSSGDHLHFEVHKNGVFVNPSNYIGSK